MACAACGTSDHRYGTTDPHHDYDATACVNSLRGEVDRLRSEVLCLRADLAWCVGWIEYAGGTVPTSAKERLVGTAHPRSEQVTDIYHDSGSSTLNVPHP